MIAFLQMAFEGSGVSGHEHVMTHLAPSQPYVSPDRDRLPAQQTDAALSISTLADVAVANVQMLMDLGPVVYVEDFEKHFLAKAAEFYQVRTMIGKPLLSTFSTA